MSRRFSALRGALADTRPLRSPDFRRLWTAGIVTAVGAQLTVVAVPTQIFGLTGSSAYVGLTGLFGLVPLVVFGLWGGAIADAVDRRLLLLLTGSGIAVTSLALWVCAANSTRTSQTFCTPVAAQAHRASEVRAMPEPVSSRSRRRSTASAIAPPQSPNTTSGTSPKSPVRPT